MHNDMTTGNPTKIILNFTFPILVGNIFQQLYSMVDTVIVGKFVGNTALAAVGSCGTLMFLILGFLMGLTAGFTVITAQHFEIHRGLVLPAVLPCSVHNKSPLWFQWQYMPV